MNDQSILFFILISGCSGIELSVCHSSFCHISTSDTNKTVYRNPKITASASSFIVITKVCLFNDTTGAH